MTDSVIADSTYLMIGARRQFFFDDLLLEQTQNLTRRYYSPQKVPANPVLRKDRPWENTLYFTCNTWNVIHDPRDGLFKCWYEDWIIDDLSNYVCWTDETSGKLCVNFHRRWPTRYLYAESCDGLTWEKPELEIVVEDGRKTNVVLGSPETGMVHSAYVLLDPLEQDEARRFKMLFEHRGLEGGDDIGSGLFCLATSGEGIHWTIGDQPVQYGQCGSIAGDVVTVSVDCDSRTYLVNNRHPRMCSIVPRDTRNPADSGWVSPSSPDDMFRQTKRRVFRSESTDLIHLSTPTPLISPDADLDNIDDEFYGMEQFQIGDDWLGLLNVFHNTDNTMDVQLAYSRNGRDFQRFRPGHPWLPLGPAESWDQGMVTICSKPIVVGDELWVFYGGTKNHHDWWLVGLPEGLEVAESSGNLDEVEYALGLAKMKVDRFVSLAASYAREGVLVTRPVVPSGGRLVINAICHKGGSMQVALADGNGKVLPGFERENCEIFSGDETAHELLWKDRPIVPAQGYVKLYFFLKNAELFSFQFVPLAAKDSAGDTA